MTMTTTQAIITIAAVVLGTMATRFIPFIIFPEGKNPPEFIKYLGTVLPYAAIGLLVIYCLKESLQAVHMDFLKQLQLFSSYCSTNGKKALF